MFGTQSLVNGLNVSYTHSSFSVCNDRGFAFYSSDPINFKFARDFGKGIKFADQWQDSNIVVLVGGGSDPMFAPNTVVVWNDHKESILAQQVFEAEIINIITSHSRLVVVLEDRIYTYKFPPILDRNAFMLKEVGHYDTISNPKGLFSLLATQTKTFLAIPGDTLGMVKIIVEEKSTLKELVLDVNSNSTSKFDRLSLFEHPKDKCLLLAVSEGGGCYIDIWDVNKKTLLIKYSRSLTPAQDVNFCWEPFGRYICVSTERKYLRYFDLSLCRNPEQNQQGYIMRSNFEKYKITLNNEGAFQTRCWFTRGSSRLIVTRINEDKEILSYDLYNEIVSLNNETIGPLPLVSYIVCDCDTSFQVIKS